ncbi:MAG: type I-F CRISPR-associated endoribonuclease Cas6/Csy4 [Thiotrichales bacterium]
MKSYVDITLLPDADIALYFLWSKVYQQIHLALVEAQDDNNTVKFGVAFPEYEYDEQNHKYTLGSKLRVFAPSENDLQALGLRKWLARLSDYVHLTQVRAVPEHVDHYAFFKRLQPKNNFARLARRKARFSGISFDEAMAYYKDRKEVYSQTPFVRIRSLSSDNQYRLLIAKEEIDSPGPTRGFSTYGLSASSAVPLF